MISLTAANVSLKPSQKKQLLARLRRSIRLGQRLGNFLLNINIKGCGRHVEVTAKGRDSFGEFTCRTRQMTLDDAVHELARRLFAWLHGHSLERAMLRVA